MISKKQILKDTITFLKARKVAQREYQEAFEKFYEDSYAPMVEGECESVIVELLETFLGDESGDISYWIYELNFGEDATEDTLEDKDGTPIPIKTIDDLYNLICS